MFNHSLAQASKATPYLVIEAQKVIEALQAFQKVFGARSIYYAVKANPEPSLIALLKEHESNFEVSSAGELELLLNLKVPPSRMISAGPIKTPDFIRDASAAGIRYFVADSASEVEKIATYAPGSKCSIRLAVSNEGSEWPLARKFGVGVEKGVQLLEIAHQSGLMPSGFTFHVGSQCTRLETWVEAIKMAQKALHLSMEKNLPVTSLNLGGGFPIKYRNAVPTIDQIANTIMEQMKDTIPQIDEIIIEPGRAIVGAAGTMVSSVIGKAVRNGQKWFYLDVGVFNGLMESLGGIKYPIAVNRQGKLSQCVLAGPSCDNLDVIDTEVDMPDIDIGERVLILSAGAYTTAYASQFGGVSAPRFLLF